MWTVVGVLGGSENDFLLTEHDSSNEFGAYKQTFDN